MEKTVIRPGFLVALKSSVDGGVSYERLDLETTGDAVAKWETTKRIDDVEEYEAAAKCRNKARNEITGVCSRTSFGLICPESAEDDLDDAFARARKLVAEHNATARYTKVEIFVLKGRIASNDEEAGRAIAAEMTGLIAAMEQGIAAMDVASIREAASKAKGVTQMLGDEQKTKVNAAIENARAAARAIVKRVEKGGEDAATVLADLKLKELEAARFMFLDTSEHVESSEPALPQVEQQRFADIDTSAPLFTTDPEKAAEIPVVATAPGAVVQPALDFDDPPVAQTLEDELRDAAQAGDKEATEELARRGFDFGGEV